MPHVGRLGICARKCQSRLRRSCNRTWCTQAGRYIANDRCRVFRYFAPPTARSCVLVLESYCGRVYVFSCHRQSYPEHPAMAGGEHCSQNRKLWQAGRMAKAFRTDVVVAEEKFQGEIRQLRKAQKPERVQCPLAGCECTYEMYGHAPSNLEGNVATLQERLKREHPDHTSEVLAVNQFRKVPK